MSDETRVVNVSEIGPVLASVLAQAATTINRMVDVSISSIEANERRAVAREAREVAREAREEAREVAREAREVARDAREARERALDELHDKLIRIEADLSERERAVEAMERKNR